MPIHPHHRAERLEPKRMRQPLEEFIAPVVMNDGLADDRAKRSHSLGQPRRNMPAMKAEVSTAGPSCHSIDSSVRQAYEIPTGNDGGK
jgi:hypothetical protein